MNAYDRLWEALKEANISTLDQLVEYLGSHELLASGEALILPNKEPENALPFDQPIDPYNIVHKMPQVPLVVDGKLLNSQEELTHYNGTPLYYTPFFVKERMALAAFTSRVLMVETASFLDDMYDWVVDVFTDPPEMENEGSCTTDYNSLGDVCWFYEHIHETGDAGSLGPKRVYKDLTRVGRAKVLWWNTGDWNDIISSISACRYNVSLYEHINSGGSEFLVQAGCSYPNLAILGWNDRASTVANWGTR